HPLQPGRVLLQHPYRRLSGRGGSGPAAGQSVSRNRLAARCVGSRGYIGVVLWCSLECTPACQAGGRGFKSRQDRHGRVAQLVERAPEKREVTGSTPVPTTTACWPTTFP